MEPVSALPTNGPGPATWWLLAAALFPALGVGLLAVAIVRRKSPGRWLEIVSALAPVGALACVAQAFRLARATMLAAIQGQMLPGEEAARLSAGINAEIMIRLYAPLIAVAALVLGAVAAGLAAARRTGASPVVTTGIPLAFVLLGFGPLAAAIFAGAWQSNRAWAATNVLPVGDKVAQIQRILQWDEHLFGLGFRISAGGCLLAGVLGLGMVWKFGRRQTGAAPAAPASLPGWVGFAVLLAIAGVAGAVAAPLRRENLLPWPAASNDGARLLVEAATPDLNGPDAIERGLVVVLDKDLQLDGRAVDLASLQDTLQLVRNNYSLLHPTEVFNGQVLLLCAPDVAGGRVRELLQTIRKAGYDTALLTFIRTEVQQRPTFGTLRRNHTTAARVRLIAAGSHPDAGELALPVNDTESYAQLARRAVDGRRKGSPVALLVP